MIIHTFNFLFSLQLSNWIQEKLKTASDESYRDLTNLERKLQKHEAFEAELKANSERLDVINKVNLSLFPFLMLHIYWLHFNKFFCALF